jgi:hypothetical protein
MAFLEGIVVIIFRLWVLRCGFRWDLWLTLFEVPLYEAFVGRVGLWEYLFNSYQAEGHTSNS